MSAKSIPRMIPLVVATWPFAAPSSALRWPRTPWMVEGSFLAKAMESTVIGRKSLVAMPNEVPQCEEATRDNATANHINFLTFVKCISRCFTRCNRGKTYGYV